MSGLLLTSVSLSCQPDFLYSKNSFAPTALFDADVPSASEDPDRGEIPSEDAAGGGIRGGYFAAIRVRGGYRTYPPDAF